MNQFVATENFAPFLIETALKAGIVLGVAAIASLILASCRASAALRHAAWALATVAVLALPFATATLPSWNIALPQGAWTVAAAAPLERSTIESESGALVSAPALAEKSTLLAAAVVPIASQDAPVATTSVVPAGPQPAIVQTHTNTIRVPWLFSLWLVGACLALAPAILGRISLWRLRRNSRQLTSGPVFDAMNQLQQQFVMRAPLTLLESPARSMPMTWGIWRPTILLPEHARRWSANRVRVVLSHEMAHFQRRDCLTQLIAQFARAVHWFNPLAWLAVRQLRVLQERACDDLVLHRGHNAADYAEHLLAVSAGYRSPACAAGLAPAMAGAAKLERRLMAILDPRQNRRSLPRYLFKSATVASLALVSLLSALRFEAEAAGDAQAVQNDQPAAVATADDAKALAELRATIAKQYVTPVKDDDMVAGAIRGMVDALHDPYSSYLTSEMMADVEKQLGGTVVGIGAQLETRDGQIRVVTPLENSPALEAGLRANDAILEIDGKSTTGMELPEAVKRIVGQQGTTVRLMIGRADGREAELNITRRTVPVATVKGFRRGTDNHWNFMLDSAAKIGYVQISQFGNTTPTELRTAIESLKSGSVKGLILDLRFCPGGSLESAIAASKLLLSDGTIVTIQSRNQETLTVKADASAALGDVPLVVLVNSETASAAEIVAGALQDNHRAIVLGTRTVGKGSVQALIKLPEGNGAIKLTTAQYRLPSGRNIDRTARATTWGVNPDDGYFVALNPERNKALLERRLAREVIGNSSEDRADSPAVSTPSDIEQQHADPQLAAALKSLAARLTIGEFDKVSSLSPAEIELALKRDDVERRRAQVLQNLEQLDNELAKLRSSR